MIKIYYINILITKKKENIEEVFPSLKPLTPQVLPLNIFTAQEPGMH